MGEHGMLKNVAEILITGSKNEDGDYHTELNFAIYEKFFKKMVTELRKQYDGEIALVLDNARYHSKQDRSIPTKTSRKTQMQDFMDEYKIRYDANEKRPQLFAKIRSAIEGRE